jgi:type IV pilus assembly protein PilM
MARAFWGIDVSRYSIKAVRLEGDKEGIVRMTDLDVSAIPAPSDPAGADAAIAQAIQELKARKKIGGAPVCISLPGHNTFNRILKLPPVEGDQVADIVKYEAQAQIPFPWEEVVWDFQKVERDYLQGEEQEVMIFAVKREIVEGFLTMIEAASLNIEVIQFAPVAMYNFLAHEMQFKGMIALDFGADNTDLMLTDGARFWIRNVPVTGNQITKALAEKLNKPFAEAERIKRKAAGSKQAQQLYAAMQPVYQELASEIHRSQGYFKSVARNVTFEKILLMGNAAKALNFQRFISQNLRLPADRIGKLNKIQVAEGVDQTVLSANLGSLGTALGLALQGLGAARNKVNLLPVRFVRIKQIKKKEPVAIGAAALLLLTAFLAYQSAAGRVAALGEKFDALTAEKDKYDKAIASYNGVKDLTEPIRLLQEAEKIYAPRDFFPKILDAVSANIPANENPDLPADQKIWVMRWSIKEHVPKELIGGVDAAGGRAPLLLPLKENRRYELLLDAIIADRDPPTGVAFLTGALLNWDPKKNAKGDAARPSAMEVPGLHLPGVAEIVWAPKPQPYLSIDKPDPEQLVDPFAFYGIVDETKDPDPDRKVSLYRHYTIKILYAPGPAPAPAAAAPPAGG